MALWNDKRTPPGVVTNTATGQHQTMSGQRVVQYPAAHDPVAARNAALGAARKTMSAPKPFNSNAPYDAPKARPTAQTPREQLDRVLHESRPRQTVGEAVINRVTGGGKNGMPTVTTKRGNKLRAKGTLKPL